MFRRSSESAAEGAPVERLRFIRISIIESHRSLTPNSFNSRPYLPRVHLKCWKSIFSFFRRVCWFVSSTGSSRIAEDLDPDSVFVDPETPTTGEVAVPSLTPGLQTLPNCPFGASRFGAGDQRQQNLLIWTRAPVLHLSLCSTCAPTAPPPHAGSFACRGAGLLPQNFVLPP